MNPIKKKVNSGESMNLLREDWKRGIELILLTREGGIDFIIMFLIFNGNGSQNDDLLKKTNNYSVCVNFFKNYVHIVPTPVFFPITSLHFPFIPNIHPFIVVHTLSHFVKDQIKMIRR